MLHFHWAENDTQGSEHTADGGQFPLEMHVVYFKAKYVYFEEAAKHDDGIVFEVHFFYIQPDDNENLNKIVGGLGSICKPGTSTKVDLISLDSILLPFTSDYLLYAGRIRAQKGGHKVIWLICRRPSGVSHRQMIGFRTLCGKDGRSLLRNFHYLYELGNRRIYHVNMSDYLIGAIYPYPRPFSRNSNKFRIQFCNLPPLINTKPHTSGYKTNLNGFKTKSSRSIVHLQENIDHCTPQTSNSKTTSNLSTSEAYINIKKLSNTSKTQLSEPQFKDTESSFGSVSSICFQGSRVNEILSENVTKQLSKINLRNIKKEENELQVTNLSIDNIREVISGLMEAQTKKIINQLKTNLTTSQSVDVSSAYKASTFKNNESIENKPKSKTKKEKKERKPTVLINQDFFEKTLKGEFGKIMELNGKIPVSRKHRGLLQHTLSSKDSKNYCLENNVNEIKIPKKQIKTMTCLSSKISFGTDLYENNKPLQMYAKNTCNKSTSKHYSTTSNSSCIRVTCPQRNVGSKHKLRKKSYCEIGNLNMYSGNSSKEYKIIKNESNAGISLQKYCDSSSSTFPFDQRTSKTYTTKNEIKLKENNNKLKLPGILKNNSKVKSNTSKGSFYFVVKKHPEKGNKHESATKNEGFLSTFLLVAKEILTSPLSVVNQSISKMSSDFGKKKYGNPTTSGMSFTTISQKITRSRRTNTSANLKNKNKKTQSVSNMYQIDNLKRKRSKKNKQVGLLSG